MNETANRMPPVDTALLRIVDNTLPMFLPELVRKQERND